MRISVAHPSKIRLKCHSSYHLRSDRHKQREIPPSFEVSVEQSFSPFCAGQIGPNSVHVSARVVSHPLNFHGQKNSPHRRRDSAHHKGRNLSPNACQCKGSMSDVLCWSRGPLLLGTQLSGE